MLKPTGISSQAWVKESWTPKDNYPKWVTEAAASSIIVGKLATRKPPVFSLMDAFRIQLGPSLSRIVEYGDYKRKNWPRQKGSLISGCNEVTGPDGVLNK
jgi:hypothetical protein